MPPDPRPSAPEAAREWLGEDGDRIDVDGPIVSSLTALLSRHAREAKVEALKWAKGHTTDPSECTERQPCIGCTIEAEIARLEAQR